MRKFKTESKKLLDLMINSIYTNREIFLRELISNASDAVDKLYFRSLTDSSVQLSKEQLAIRVSFDKEARTVTVSDNGLGMGKDELDLNLGTIAHSDSMSFKEENAEQQGEDVDIIGQFGVGFYSSFMVASRVRVVSRAFGSDEAWAWESDGVEGYSIIPAQRLEHGTDVILTLKENTEDENYDTYLSEYGLRSLIKRYSNYVRYPITMEVTKSREVAKATVEGEEPDPDAIPEYEDYTEVETINSMIPIWKRRKSEVTDEEYAEFYKSDFHDFADPALTFSVHAEGALSYDALMFIPDHAPYDLYSKDFKKGLALYTSNVLIMEKCEELLPDYYSFVRGVVDSQDLTLNISRETLQHNSQLTAIAKRLEKKITAELKKMRDDDRPAYENLFREFGRCLKFGIYSSYGMKKDPLADLLLFYSCKQEKPITLAEYAEGCQEGQTEIYYAAGQDAERLSRMPIVKTVLDRGFDVLLCTEDVDEFCLSAMMFYGEEEKQMAFKNVASGELDFSSEEEKKEAEEAGEQNKDLFDAMLETLGDAVTSVKISSRLSTTPSCITAAGPVSLEMERILAQAPDAEDFKSERVLELNAKHPVFRTLQQAYEAGDTEKLACYTDILYNQALLAEGIVLDDPAKFIEEISQLMV